jgi:hypothetical protein
VADRVGVVDGVWVDVGVADRVPVELSDTLLDKDGYPVGVQEGRGDTETDGRALCERRELCDREGLGEAEIDTLTDRLAETEALDDGLND